MENFPPANSFAILESPCFDLTDMEYPEFAFSYHMFGAGIAVLYLDLSLDGINFETTLWSQNGQVQNSNNAPWELVVIDLSSYVDRDIKLRFRGVTGSLLVGL